MKIKWKSYIEYEDGYYVGVTEDDVTYICDRIGRVLYGPLTPEQKEHIYEVIYELAQLD